MGEPGNLIPIGASLSVSLCSGYASSFLSRLFTRSTPCHTFWVSEIILCYFIIFRKFSIEMKDDDSLPSTTAGASLISRKESLDSSPFGRGRYKFWALAAILLLAFWSMFTGTVTLRWSAGNLNRLADAIGPTIKDDLDVLEMEEREKVVKHMWDVYTNSHRIRLPRFWQEAFVAAYEDLTSEVPGVREAAVTEIAKMSVRSIDLDPPPLHSTRVLEFRKSLEQGVKR